MAIILKIRWAFYYLFRYKIQIIQVGSARGYADLVRWWLNRDFKQCLVIFQRFCEPGWCNNAFVTTNLICLLFITLIACVIKLGFHIR